MLLILTPAFAAPASSLINGMLQQSPNKPVSAQSVIDPAALIEEIKKKLAATSAELALVPPEAVAGSPATGSFGEVDIFARRLHLKPLEFIYQSQFARLASLQVLQQHRLEMENQAANWSGFNEPSRHPFLRADELKESVTRLSSRVEELKSLATTTDQAGVQVINTAENSIVKLRQADEAVEQSKNSPDQQVRLSRGRDLLALQNQVDLARVMAFQIEKQTIHEDLLETLAQLQLARKQLGVASEQVELTQQDIDQVNKNIESESQQIIAELKRVVTVSDLKNKADQQERLEPSATGQAVTQLQFAEPDQIGQARHNNADIKLQALNRMLLYLQMQRDIWNLRWAYAKVTNREKAGVAYDKIAQNQAVLKAVHNYIDQQRHSVLMLVTSQSVQELDPTVAGLDALGDELHDL
jgi:hypothetical protein